MKNKSEVYNKFVHFKKEVENQFSMTIKQFQCDGGEIMNAKFQKLFQESGIITRVSCPQTPQQNGMAKRMHRNLLNTV